MQKDKIDKKLFLYGQFSRLAERATGRTTLLIDKYIQELYIHKGEWIQIVDHYPTLGASEQLKDAIMKRMTLEHPNDVVEINHNKAFYELKLKSCPSRECVERELDIIMEKIKALS